MFEIQMKPIDQRPCHANRCWCASPRRTLRSQTRYVFGEAIATLGCNSNQIQGPPWPLVCSDLWYLNDTELRVPNYLYWDTQTLNAATAALSPKLETVHLEDDAFRIQLRPRIYRSSSVVFGV